MAFLRKRIQVDADPLKVRSMLTPAYLLDQLRRWPSASTYWVGYSGGIDSSVLLTLFAEIRPLLPHSIVKAIHVHHGLHDHADQWTAHCSSYSGQLEIPLVIIKVDARHAPGESPEEKARNCRYEAFASIIKPKDALVLAQHQDDQAETFLLQLFRGAGLRGLSAMPLRTSFQDGCLMRPLLGVTREDIMKVGLEKDISWVEDPSNQDTRMDRNLVRREILPIIQQRWPTLSVVIARSAQHVAEAEQLLEEAIEEHYEKTLKGSCLDVDRLIRLGPALQRAIVRRWIRCLGYRLPSTKMIERICGEGLSAAEDRNPNIAWAQGQIRRYRGRLYLHPPRPEIPKVTSVPIASTTRLIQLEQNGRLVLHETFGDGIDLMDWHAHKISVRYRQGGEKIKIKGRAGHQDLRKLFQEAGVPPWVRKTMPIIYLDEKLAAVGDLWIDEAFSAAAKNTQGLKPERQDP